jgi:drug/metabolite transporter (DMT)-like permease
MVALLALLASLVWGTSDFVGGVVSRRVRPLVVVGLAHLVALATLLVVAAAVGAFSAGAGYLPWALAAGAVGFVGLVAFYGALSTGTMGIVAPIAGTGAVVPVIVGLIGGDSPTALQLAGIGAAVAGVVLASGPELSGSGTGGRRPLLLALVAALAFGLVFVLIDRGSAHSVLMTLLLMRATSVLIVSCLAAAYLVRRRGLRASGLGTTRLPALPAARDMAIIGFVGWTDAGANGLYGLASRHGLVSVVSVLASLYPAVTVVLARVLDDERMRRIQVAGVVLALCGVVLLAAG